jgi:hypothetical protein
VGARRVGEVIQAGCDYCRWLFGPSTIPCLQARVGKLWARLAKEARYGDFTSRHAGVQEHFLHVSVEEYFSEAAAKMVCTSFADALVLFMSRCQVLTQYSLPTCPTSAVSSSRLVQMPKRVLILAMQ